MSRIMSSFKPGGTESSGISVTKPHLYSRLASASMVSTCVLMLPHLHGSESVLKSQDLSGTRRRPPASVESIGMADKNMKWPENAPGPFFVDEACIGSEFCVSVAPEHFRMSKTGMPMYFASRRRLRKRL